MVVSFVGRLRVKSKLVTDISVRVVRKYFSVTVRFCVAMSQVSVTTLMFFCVDDMLFVHHVYSRCCFM